MATPNLTSGIVERNKPQNYSRPHVVWRFEGVLNAGSSISTPVFDTVPDGRPLTEIEVAQGIGIRLVRVASAYFRIAVVMPSGSGSNNPGGRLQVFHIADAGGQGSPFTFYVQPRSGSGANFYRYHCIGRRCQFRLQNVPLGPVAALNQTYQCEITVEG